MHNNDMARTLSAKEIAARHGVSPRTVRRLAADGQLPADQVGKQYRFDAEEVGQVLSLSQSSSVRKPQN